MTDTHKSPNEMLSQLKHTVSAWESQLSTIVSDLEEKDALIATLKAELDNHGWSSEEASDGTAGVGFSVLEKQLRDRNSTIATLESKLDRTEPSAANSLMLPSPSCSKLSVDITQSPVPSVAGNTQ